MIMLSVMPLSRIASKAKCWSTILRFMGNIPRIYLSTYVVPSKAFSARLWTAPEQLKACPPYMCATGGISAVISIISFLMVFKFDDSTRSIRLFLQDFKNFLLINPISSESQSIAFSDPVPPFVRLIPVLALHVGSVKKSDSGRWYFDLYFIVYASGLIILPVFDHDFCLIFDTLIQLFPFSSLDSALCLIHQWCTSQLLLPWFCYFPLSFFVLLGSSKIQLVDGCSRLQKDLPGHHLALAFRGCLEWQTSFGPPPRTLTVLRSRQLLFQSRKPTVRWWWTGMSIFHTENDDLHLTRVLKFFSRFWMTFSRSCGGINGQFDGLWYCVKRTLQYRTLSRPYIDFVLTAVEEMANEAAFASVKAANSTRFSLYGLLSYV